MGRKPKRIKITEVIVDSVEIHGTKIEDLYESFEQEYGGFEGYTDVRFEWGEETEEWQGLNIVGERLENDKEYSKRVSKLKKSKADELEFKQTKLKQINSQMAQLEKEKIKLEKATVKRISPSKSRIESVH